MENSTACENLPVLHLCWEMPPLITGGLGVACAGWVEALLGRCALKVVRADKWLRQSGKECVSVYGSYQSGALWSLSKEFAEYVEKRVSGWGLGSRWVVHTHDWMTAEAGMRLQIAYGVKLVSHWHSTELERSGEHARNTIYKLEMQAMAQSDAIVAVSRVSGDLLQREYAVAVEKLHVIHHGARTTLYQDDCEKVAECLMFAGRLCEQKGAQFMMAVVARMLVERPQLRVIVAGDGELMPMLRAEADFRGWGGRVCFLGQVPHENMVELYRNASVLCVPSYAEPFGLVAIEAAAAGTAVLLAEYCGAAEILNHTPRLRVGDIDGWCAALHRLLDDPIMYRRWVQLGKEKAAARTWQVAAGEMLGVYAALAD